jgi:ABC-type sugar transport system ATPase subunit
MKNQPVLKAEGIAKHYGSVVALSNVDFEIGRGEVVGLVGDNGAGKSTFIKVISGVHKRDRGRLLLDGKEVNFDNPKEAISAGIETVYQDLAIAPHLDVFSNIFLGREETYKGLFGKMGFVNRKVMKEFVVEELKRLRITIKSVDQKVGTLSGGQRQCVAIARSVAWGKKIIIMDEPTAALGVEQSQMVLNLINEIKSRGLSVILISHTLPHVMEVCDKITVLRLGETIANLDRNETNLDEVVQWITGSKTIKN